MTTIAEMYRRFSSFSLKEDLPYIIAEDESMLAEMNVKQMFEQGIDSKGQQLPPYSATTESIKRQKNQPIDRTTFRDTGSFHNNLYAEVDDPFIKFDSTDYKTPILIDKGGEDIFGLTIDNKSKYVKETLFQKIKKYIQDKTGVTFS